MIAATVSWRGLTQRICPPAVFSDASPAVRIAGQQQDSEAGGQDEGETDQRFQHLRPKALGQRQQQRAGPAPPSGALRSLDHKAVASQAQQVGRK